MKKPSTPKQWLTLPEAARRLTMVFDEEVGEADVLRLALDGHRPKPLPASQAIAVLAFESTLTAVAAGNIANGVVLTDADRARLRVAAKRINTISGAFA